MFAFQLTAAAIALLIWLYVLLGRGQFWRVNRFMSPSVTSELAARVAVVIPARDEAKFIGRSVTSLLTQAGPQRLHIFLVDDGSSDGTAQTARQAAQASNASDALTVVQSKPLPPGWSGKMWAMQQGVERAAEFNPDFLLMADADIQHAPDNVARLVAIAESGGYDLVSFMVKLHCAAGAEKLLIPAFVFFFFMLYPPAWIADARRGTAGAAGGCLLIRPEALARAGGIAIIRERVIDDCALAVAVKRSGEKLWLGLTADTASIRPYNSFAEIGRMISRTAFSQLRHSVWLLLGTIVGLVITFVFPVALVFSGHAPAMALAGAAWAVMTICYLPMVRFYGLNPLSALSLPMAAVFYMGATIASALKFWSGRGGEWKGRVQDPLAARDEASMRNAG